MSPRIVLSDSQLIAYSGEHLLYELHMFRWLADTLPGRLPGFELSALLESFAIHLRNLIDFFFCASPRGDDDVIAAYFFDQPNAWAPGIMSPTLQDARERANKEISHITRRRKTGADPTKPWQVEALFNEIDALARKFATGASRKKLHPDVVSWLSSPVTRAVLLVNASTRTTNTVAQVTTVRLDPDRTRH